MRHLPPQLRQLLDEDHRYQVEAYQFVQESLIHAQQVLRKGGHRPTDQAVSSDKSAAPRYEPHLTGQELCVALRLRAIEQYGYLAKTVLNKWGIRTTGDFGEIVYNLIAIECLKKSKSDRREDFDEVYDFDAAFRQDFRITIQE